MILPTAQSYTSILYKHQLSSISVFTSTCFSLMLCAPSDACTSLWTLLSSVFLPQCLFSSHFPARTSCMTRTCCFVFPRDPLSLLKLSNFGKTASNPLSPNYLWVCNLATILAKNTSAQLIVNVRVSFPIPLVLLCLIFNEHLLYVIALPTRQYVTIFFLQVDAVWLLFTPLSGLLFSFFLKLINCVLSRWFLCCWFLHSN